MPKSIFPSWFILHALSLSYYYYYYWNVRHYFVVSLASFFSYIFWINIISVINNKLLLLYCIPCCCGRGPFFIIIARRLLTTDTRFSFVSRVFSSLSSYQPHKSKIFYYSTTTIFFQLFVSVLRFAEPYLMKFCTILLVIRLDRIFSFTKTFVI